MALEISPQLGLESQLDEEYDNYPDEVGSVTAEAVDQADPAFQNDHDLSAPIHASKASPPSPRSRANYELPEDDSKDAVEVAEEDTITWEDDGDEMDDNNGAPLTGDGYGADEQVASGETNGAAVNEEDLQISYEDDDNTTSYPELGNVLEAEIQHEMDHEQELEGADAQAGQSHPEVNEIDYEDDLGPTELENNQGASHYDEFEISAEDPAQTTRQTYSSLDEDMNQEIEYDEDQEGAELEAPDVAGEGESSNMAGSLDADDEYAPIEDEAEGDDALAESSASSLDTPAELGGDIPAVSVSWRGNDYPLFYNAPGSEEQECFFDDVNVLHHKMEDVLASFRRELAAEMTVSEELVMQVDELGLEIAESTRMDHLAEITLGTIIQIFEHLVKNKDPDASRRLRIYLVTRPACGTRWHSLIEDAYQGKSIDEVCYYFQPPSQQQTARGGDEDLAGSGDEFQDQNGMLSIHSEGGIGAQEGLDLENDESGQDLLAEDEAGAENYAHDELNQDDLINEEQAAELLDMTVMDAAQETLEDASLDVDALGMDAATPGDPSALGLPSADIMGTNAVSREVGVDIGQTQDNAPQTEDANAPSVHLDVDVTTSSGDSATIPHQGIDGDELSAQQVTSETSASATLAAGDEDDFGADIDFTADIDADNTGDGEYEAQPGTQNDLDEIDWRESPDRDDDAPLDTASVSSKRPRPVEDGPENAEDEQDVKRRRA